MTSAHRVAARYASDVLTKEWLMGVRRGWLKVMDPPIGDWDDVHRAYQNLALFIKNLTDQVFYARRGPYTGSPTMSEGAKVLKILGQISAAISDLQSKAKHWQTVQEGKTPAGGGFRQEEGELMLNKYRTDFPGTSEIGLKGPGGKWRYGSLTEMMDKVFKILREDAARIKEHDEANPNTPYEDRNVYKEFDLHGMKVVIDDSSLLPSEINEYVKYLDEAYQRLKQKGFGKVWYGTIFVKCKDCGGTNQYGPELGVGGNYPIGPDVVNVFSRPSKFIVELIVHELGHRYWFKFMSQGQRGKFEELINITVPPPPELDRLISDTKGQHAKAMVDLAYDVMKRLLKDFGSSRLKWWVDIIKKFEDPLVQAAHQATQDIITAMQYPGSWINTPENKQLHDDAIRASGEVSKRVFDMDSFLKAEVHKIPDPAAAPEDRDAYWLRLFKPIQKWWIEDTIIAIEGAITATYIYIDASIASYNQAEKDRNEASVKKWTERKREMEKRVPPVSNYGGKHIDEAWAEAFAHYVTGEDMTRDQIDSFKSVLKTAAERVAERYRQALQEITPASVERWRKDLRVMTKIYKSIGPEGTERDLGLWDEAEQLFRTFRENFEQWAYRILLPKVEKGREPYLYKDVQKQVWDALFYIRTDELFPTVYDHANPNKRLRATWELKNIRDRYIARYNKAFNKALKTIDEFIDGKTLVRETDEKYNIAGMNVLVTGYGRGENEEDVEVFLHRLKDYAAPVIQAGFKKAIDGVRIILDFNPGSAEGLTNAKYQVAEDSMVVYPLGMIRSGGTFAHEMGHRYWFKSMTNQARAYWNDVMEKQGAKIEQEDIDGFFKFVMSVSNGDVLAHHHKLHALVDRLSVSEITKAKYRILADMSPYGSQARFELEAYRKALGNYLGDSVLLEGVSEYAASGGPVEAFAEVFRIYTTKGSGALGPFTLDLFKRVVPTGGVRLGVKQAVVVKFLLAQG